MLLAGVSDPTDALAVRPIGVGIGSAVHTISRIVGQDLGGKPEVDIPLFAASEEIGLSLIFVPTAEGVSAVAV